MGSKNRLPSSAAREGRKNRGKIYQRHRRIVQAFSNPRAKVLGRFAKDEMPILDKSAKNVAEAIKLIIKNGDCAMAMNKYNGK